MDSVLLSFEVFINCLICSPKLFLVYEFDVMSRLYLNFNSSRSLFSLAMASFLTLTMSMLLPYKAEILFAELLFSMFSNCATYSFCFYFYATVFFSYSISCLFRRLSWLNDSVFRLSSTSNVFHFSSLDLLISWVCWSCIKNLLLSCMLFCSWSLIFRKSFSKGASFRIIYSCLAILNLSCPF
jgi:hypothetical protein